MFDSYFCLEGDDLLSLNSKPETLYSNENAYRKTRPAHLYIRSWP